VGKAFYIRLSYQNFFYSTSLKNLLSFPQHLRNTGMLYFTAHSCFNCSKQVIYNIFLLLTRDTAWIVTVRTVRYRFTIINTLVFSTLYHGLWSPYQILLPACNLYAEQLTFSEATIRCFNAVLCHYIPTPYCMTARCRIVLQETLTCAVNTETDWAKCSVVTAVGLKIAVCDRVYWTAVRTNRLPSYWGHNGIYC